MSARKNVEIFTAGCPVCAETVEQVRAALCDDCEITVYDLNKGCETNVCREKAKAYGVKSVPAVAIDGKLADCCSSRGINIDSIKSQVGL
jgi:hypothetical protein